MSRLLSIGAAFPIFSGEAAVSLEKGKEFKTLSNADIQGKWAVLFFWPLDFTFVCPTEIAEFNKHAGDFADRDTVLIGASADSHFTHAAWRRDHADLRDLKFPMYSDYTKELSEALGILHPKDKVPLRVTYIVDPEGIVRHVSVNDLNVGRNPKETLRILDALQTDELCPCNWEKGEKTLTA